MNDTKSNKRVTNDARHRARGRADLSDGSEVWVTGGGDGDPVPGQVIRSADTPRSYIVSTPSGLVRSTRPWYQHRKGKNTKILNTSHL